MVKKLRLGPGVSIDAKKFSTSVLGIIAKRGRGKSGLLKVLIEELSKAGEQFIVFDPMAIKDLQALASPSGPFSLRGDAEDLPLDPLPKGKGDAPLTDRAAAEAAFTPAEMQYMDDQTVARDYKLIKQSDLVVVY